MTSTVPLGGLVVIEIGHSVAAPYAGLILGQLGADVIKVEHPNGGDHARRWGAPVHDQSSALFQALNREKRGVAFDLRDAKSREALATLIVERADIVIQNLRPGSIEGLGLAATDLSLRKPELIYCNLSAFGGVGPMGSKPGYDPLMQAYGGLMNVTGEEGGSPVRVGVSIIDMGAALWSVIGILAALQERSRNRRGGVIDTSLFETALAWMGVHVAELTAGAGDPKRHGSGAPQIVPYEAFTTANGILMVAAGNDSLFNKLCRVLDRTQWISDPLFCANPQRVKNRERLSAMLKEIFVTQTTAHWRDLLDREGIPNAPLRNVSEVLADAQTHALDILQDSRSAGLTTVGIPIRFDSRRPRARLPAPRLGEHTREVDKFSLGQSSLDEKRET